MTKKWFLVIFRIQYPTHPKPNTSTQYLLFTIRDISDLEVSDGEPRSSVCPIHNLSLSDHDVPGPQPGEQGQGVGPHQLPHNGQGKGGVTLHDVRP